MSKYLNVSVLRYNPQEKYKYSLLFYIAMRNCCDMRGFLSFIVLKLICKRNMSGEDIRQELKKRKVGMKLPGIF